ncbi:ThiF family adenylyltransferase [Methylotenera sp.]|uniref:HesA/MoeB/ThiF family protein n=1 Tax=Methylotenera sp. TaxID=2051956 RepID=UPI002ED93B34
MKRKYSRQSFLGEQSDEIFASAKIGFIGLGGGGSHIVQQFAHLGLGNFVLVDFDRIEDTNLNRLVGGTVRDVEHNELKTTIAQRVIRQVNPDASIQVLNTTWQESAKQLRDCDLIFGCLDSYHQRRDLEIFTRRYLIPYIDIGMDVHKINDNYYISGQVILSLPGNLCMHCMKFLNEDRLTKEAKKYGDAGGNPQVIWPNGVLASSAVGIGVQILTSWGSMSTGAIYLEYDGSDGTINSSPRMKYLETAVCTHFKDTEAMGDPFYANS